MVAKTNQKLLLGAAGTLAVGALAAVQIATSQPVAVVAETGTLRQLAQRLAEEPSPVVRPVVPPARFTPVASESQPRPSVRRTVASAQTPRRPQVPASKSDTPSQEAIADAVKNIALMGVTHMGDEDQVWLVDISNNERQVVEEGEDAFGFKVMQIEDESVVLTRGSDRWELKLGEKQIPSTTPELATFASDPGMGGFPGGGRDGRGFGGWGGMRGGGGDGGGRSSNRGGGRGSWGGGSSRGGGNFGGGNRSGWGNTGFRPTFSGFGGGGFNRGGFGGGGGGFGGFNQGNRNSGAQLATSNAQTARRRGSRLVGGTDPMPSPAAVSNPQTVRRRGSSSGSAFGDNSNSSRNRNGNQNRNR